MSALFEIFGFLGVVVHGIELVAQTVMLGSISFAIFIYGPLARREGGTSASLGSVVRRAILASAAATAAAVLIQTLLSATVLAATLQRPWSDVAGASFVIEGAIQALAAAAVYAVARGRPVGAASTNLSIALLGATALCAGLGRTHAAARLADPLLMLVATGAHELGAAIWLGGLPCFHAALGRVNESDELSWIGRRYSVLSIVGVGLIVAGAVVLAIRFIGSIQGVYGTAYGAMAATKSLLFGMLLLLGASNYRSVRAFSVDPRRSSRVRRFVQVEMGIAFAVLMAAASITSMPPAVDLTLDRVSLRELAERMRPEVPSLHSPDREALSIPALQARLDEEWRQGHTSNRVEAFVPGTGAVPPRNAEDVAWSEYNHHWAGLLVMIIGIAALLAQSGRIPWAKHWPLLFLALAAFLFFRSDPETWPSGDIGFLESLKDPEVVQHRIFVVIVVVFACFEWCVRTGRLTSLRWQRIFPLMTAAGGTLLLTHSHALANVKEAMLIEATHLPLAVLGIVAGWTRWLEIEAPTEDARWAGWVWPSCFVLIGALLLNYREA